MVGNERAPLPRKWRRFSTLTSKRQLHRNGEFGVNGKRTHEARLLTERARFWRGSLYEEPIWVSLAWLIGPMLLAGLGIYFAVR
jgi:hypothetical protein